MIPTNSNRAAELVAHVGFAMWRLLVDVWLTVDRWRRRR
jgi:hypothetical protein